MRNPRWQHTARLLIVSIIFTFGVVLGGVMASSTLLAIALLVLVGLFITVLWYVGRSVTKEIEAAREEGLVDG